MITYCRRPLEGFYIEACAETRWRMIDKCGPCILIFRLLEIFQRTLRAFSSGNDWFRSFWPIQTTLPYSFQEVLSIPLHSIRIPVPTHCQRMKTGTGNDERMSVRRGSLIGGGNKTTGEASNTSPSPRYPKQRQTQTIRLSSPTRTPTARLALV
jgi:hypothetical protein